MSAPRKRVLPTEPVVAHLESLAHDGRGIAHLEGKAVFIDGALPGETVAFRYTARHGKHDEGRVSNVLVPSPERVEPRCLHAAICGGCSLQHLAPQAQIEAKQQVLIENLDRIGGVRPETLLEPLSGAVWGYRYKARLGVKHVVKKGRVLVGFREKGSSYLADLSGCEILHPCVGTRLTGLQGLISQLSISDRIPQIEVAVGDDAAALVFRVLDSPTENDVERLQRFARDCNLHLYLQPKGPDSLSLLWPAVSELSYRLPAYGLELGFLPTDFTQINPDINRKMIDHALRLLAPGPNESVLDLYCGLGNFTLPLARRAAQVTGVEGDAGLVARARQNARRNGIGNVVFHVANLVGLTGQECWVRNGYDKALLDPPRSGAAALLPQLRRLAPGSLVYVSCHPGSLARDAGLLIREAGYRLAAAGVMDMFPHTVHVESIALFERR